MKEKIKSTEDQGEKQVDALKNVKLIDQTKSNEGLFPKSQESDKIRNELCKYKSYKNRVIRDIFLWIKQAGIWY